MIRVARRQDVAAMLEIYAPFVSDSAVSFECRVPTLAEFDARLERILARYPWLVWEENGAVLGYAYADEAFPRAAYRWCADMTIYLGPGARHRGVGDALYDRLEGIMASLGYRRLYALVTADNRDSCRFHERRGYELQGLLKQTGWKNGQWHDVNWYALSLGGDVPPAGEPRRFDAESFE